MMNKSMAAILFLGMLSSPSLARALEGIRWLEGSWLNVETDEQIKIEREPVGGWTFWASGFGQARIDLTHNQGANIVVSGQGFECYYMARKLKGGDGMSWQLRAVNGDRA